MKNPPSAGPVTGTGDTGAGAGAPGAPPAKVPPARRPAAIPAEAASAPAETGLHTPPGRPVRQAMPYAVRQTVRYAIRYAPAAVATVTGLAVLRQGGVPVGQTAAFGGYVAFGVALPGTLLWRAVRRGAGHLAEDIAAGTALGYAIEVLTYLPARWAGVPRVFLVWPVATFLLFLTVPGLRRHWRGSGSRAPAAWSWALGLLVSLTFGYGGRAVFRTLGIAWPRDRSPHVDMTFHLALAGELRHHIPPAVPWAAGEPLRYHWFVHADIAATSWATGLEPVVLLYRLSVLPMIAAFAVLLAALARRTAGRWWAGAAAAYLCFLVVSPSPYPWLPSLDADTAQLADRIWLSPTQTFGAVLFAPLVVVITDLLRDTPGTRRQGAAVWAAVCVLLAAVMGAKATFLPILLAALVLCVIVEAATRRRVRGSTVGLAGVVLGFVLFAQLVFFRGTAQGMTVDPEATARFLAGRLLPGHTSVAVLAFATAVTAAGWGCVWAGLAGFARRPRALLDPVTVLPLGIGAAGMGALFMFSQPCLSQYYFSRSATPYLAVAAVQGLVLLVPQQAAGRRPVTAVVAVAAGAAGAGIGVILLVRPMLLWLGSRRPGPHGAHAAHGAGATAMTALGAPVVLVVVAGCATLAVIALTRRLAPLRGLGAVAAVALAAGLALPASARRLPADAGIVRAGARPAARPKLISPGGEYAARWLRGHSAPHDLVATNAHCLSPREHGTAGAPGACDSRNFWIAAYTERRVLVEGWSYTDRATERALRLGVPYNRAPYWDERLLADNDAVFGAPSAATVARLRDRYGARWLFADDRAGAVSPRLASYAVLRFRSGACAVYELPAATSAPLRAPDPGDGTRMTSGPLMPRHRARALTR